MTDTSHLNDETAKLLDLSNEERAGFMLKERFFPHERIVDLLDYVDFLRLSPRQTRASGLVISGDPGCGKTMLCGAVMRRAMADAAANLVPAQSVMSITMTGAREAKTLYNRMLDALKVPDAGRYMGSEREQMVIKLCRNAQVRMLVVDEIQDVLTSTARQQAIAFDTIKFLMNELSLSVLVLGTPAAPDAMRLNPHLNARFEYRPMPTWRQDGFLTNFLDDFERSLPLRKPSKLSSLPMSNAILSRAKGTLHRIVQLMSHAATYAVEEGVEQITPAMILKAATKPPITALRLLAKEAAENGRVA